MDVSSIASMATSLASTQTNDAVGISVLRKAMDIGAAHAEQLIASLPEVPVAASNLPLHLGQNIDTTA